MSDVITENPEASRITRRGLYVAAIYALGAAMGVALALPAAMYLLIPPRARRQSGWIDAGDVSQLAPERPIEMSFQKSRIDGWRTVTEKRTAWVVRKANNRTVAFGPQCTHLGCAYHWDDAGKNFVCPCHASYFSMEGEVLSGPAPRPLDRYETKIQSNRLQIGELKIANASKA